jgi:hypothetical protein
VRRRAPDQQPRYHITFFPEDEEDTEYWTTSDAIDCQARGTQPPTDLDIKLRIVLGLAACLLQRWVWHEVSTALLYVVGFLVRLVLQCMLDLMGSSISYCLTLLDSEFMACVR